MKIEKRKAESFLFKAVPYQRAAQDMSLYHTVNSADQVHPEHDAVLFYLCTHLLNEIEKRYEGVTLSESQAFLVEELYQHIEGVFFRMFTYVMLISIGESRHGKITYKQSQIIEKFGQDVWELAKKIGGTTRSESRWEFLQSNREVLTFMEYCDWMFIKCFNGGSVGGPKWRDISHKCTQVLTGEISPYLMVDVSWAMVHNCGSIFNKNTIYYQAQDFQGLVQLLDLQRAGAIPALVESPEFYHGAGIKSANFSVKVEHLDILTRMKKNFELEGIDKIVTLAQIKKAGALSHHIKQVKTVDECNMVKDYADEFVAAGDIVMGPVDLTIYKKVRDEQ